jgi:hypothetical protein
MALACASVNGPPESAIGVIPDTRVGALLAADFSGVAFVFRFPLVFAIVVTSLFSMYLWSERSSTTALLL